MFFSFYFGNMIDVNMTAGNCAPNKPITWFFIHIMDSSCYMARTLNSWLVLCLKEICSELTVAFICHVDANKISRVAILDRKCQNENVVQNAPVCRWTRSLMALFLSFAECNNVRKVNFISIFTCRRCESLLRFRVITISKVFEYYMKCEMVYIRIHALSSRDAYCW